MNKVELAVAHLESDPSFSGGLRQYNVGTGKLIQPIVIQQDPSSQVSNDQIAKTLIGWINSETVAALGTTGAYNIFLPPGTTASLSGDLSCNSFCDYCDANFVCNKIATGEYVNSWYDKSKNACWIGRK